MVTATRRLLLTYILEMALCQMSFLGLVKHIEELVTNPKNVCVLNKESIKRQEEATCGVGYDPISRSVRYDLI